MTQTWNNSDFETGTASHIWLHFCEKNHRLIIKFKKKNKKKPLALASASNIYFIELFSSQTAVSCKIVGIAGILPTENRVFVAHKITVVYSLFKKTKQPNKKNLYRYESNPRTANIRDKS